LNVLAAARNRDLLRQQLEEHVADDAGHLLDQRVEATADPELRAKTVNRASAKFGLVDPVGRADDAVDRS
jgi:hypothetical protein